MTFSVQTDDSLATSFIFSTGSEIEGEYLENTLYTPVNHVTMITFLKLPYRYDSFGNKRDGICGLKLATIDNNGSKSTVLDGCDYDQNETYLLEANNITMRWRVGFRECLLSQGCFKMLVSFHSMKRRPERFSNGLYNWRFQQHFDCNMVVECKNGRDETEHCPFSSSACNGWIVSGNKCFMLVTRKTVSRLESYETGPPIKTEQSCLLMNASFGDFSLSDRRFESNVFDPLMKTNRFMSRYLSSGAFAGGSSMSNEYRTSLVNPDKTVLHTARFSAAYDGKKRCCDIYMRRYTCANNYQCNLCSFRRKPRNVICGIALNKRGATKSNSTAIKLPQASFTLGSLRISLTTCVDGHLIHVFLPCNGNNTTIPWFRCDNDVSSVSYTLVCDFRQDCHDGSDEIFCEYPPCDGFICISGQCVSHFKRCNIASDCIDGSDESDCFEHYGFKREQNCLPSPAFVHFYDTGSFTAFKMSSEESCPDTHYRCPGEYNDCLPIFTRCNGWYDCVERQDEEGCEAMTCPGFYRCLNSTVCVHGDDLCDRWPHCPQSDDEWLCYMTCPEQCMCEGHAFVCPNHFSAYHFKQLRYLNAQESGMTLADVYNNPYLVHLILRWCSLSNVSSVTLDNLQTLDLSRNSLQMLNSDVFAGLSNLRTLLLSESPLRMLIGSSVQQTALRRLRLTDVSFTELQAIDCHDVSIFSYLHSLNLSFTTLHTLQSDSFRCTPRLVNLYLKGSPVKSFTANVFKPLSRLRFVYTDNYRLCCKQILPVQPEFLTCDAPKDYISSCDDLLKSLLYSVFLWFVSIMSLLGNVFCLVMRACVQRSASVSGFYVFVSNLSMSDLLMGVYIAIIGVADQLFRGKYLHYDETWTHSVACKVAGFLSLLSSEVSALTIWLITLDRFVVLRFPFSRVRFQKTSAGAACLSTWCVGFVLALIPLLPITSHWEFYSQTGICIPLPVTGHDFKGRAYSVSVLIILNFALFILIATGQAFIYWSVQENSLKTSTTKVSRDLTMGSAANLSCRDRFPVLVPHWSLWSAGLCGHSNLWGGECGHGHFCAAAELCSEPFCLHVQHSHGEEKEV